MAQENIAGDSQARGEHNEDFKHVTRLGQADILIVGDFAPGTLPGADKLAIQELQALLSEPSLASLPVALQLTQLATQFNKRLLVYRQIYNTNFQCSVLFAALTGATLYYLQIGDCRPAIRRGDNLLLLGNSIWLDDKGGALPTVIAASQRVRPSRDDRPDEALGHTDMAIQPERVKSFPLETDDLVLLYSDGIDKSLSPVDVLKLLTEAPATASPQALVELLLKETQIKGYDDDRTLLIATGPFQAPADHAFARLEALPQQFEAQIKRSLDELREAVVKQVKEDQARIEKKIDDRLTGFPQLIGEKVKEEQAQLRKDIEALRSNVNQETNGAREKIEQEIAHVRSESAQHLKDYMTTLEQEVGNLKNEFSGLLTLSDIQRELPLAIRNALPTQPIAIQSQSEPSQPNQQLQSLSKSIDALTANVNRAIDELSKAKAGATYFNSVMPAPPEVSGAAQGNAGKLAEAGDVTPATPPPPLSPELTRGEVIRVSARGFELVDAVDSNSDCYCISKPDGASPGWQTARYLYLRYLYKPERPWAKLAMREVMDHIEHCRPPDFRRLSSDFLAELCNEHLQLREQLRENSPATVTAFNKGEPELAKRLRQELDRLSKSEPSLGIEGQDSVQPPRQGPDRERESEPSSGVGKGLIKAINSLPNKLYRFVVPISETWKSLSGQHKLVVLGSAIVLLLLGNILPKWVPSSSAPPPDSTATPTPSPEGHLLWIADADGRTILLLDEKTNRSVPTVRRISLGYEKQFQELIGKQKFNTSVEANNWLTERMPMLMLTGEAFPDSAQRRAYKVMNEDIAGNNTCQKFLDRINKGLPSSVHIELDGARGLRETNPGLKCEGLKPGHTLVVDLTP